MLFVGFEGIEDFTADDVFAILLYMIIAGMLTMDDTSQQCVTACFYPQLVQEDNLNTTIHESPSKMNYSPSKRRNFQYYIEDTGEHYQVKYREVPSSRYKKASMD